MAILVSGQIIFLHACTDFYEHVALLFSGLLIHRYVPEMMLCSTVIPIPKGKHCNVTNSDNYRGIALSSIFGKMFDLIILNRYSDDLTSCDLQFGLKRTDLLICVRSCKQNQFLIMLTMALLYFVHFLMLQRPLTVLHIVSYFVSLSNEAYLLLLYVFCLIGLCMLIRGSGWGLTVFILLCLVSQMESSRVRLPVPLCFAFTLMSC